MFIEKITDNEKLLINTMRHMGVCDDDEEELSTTQEYVSCEDFLSHWEHNKSSSLFRIKDIFKDKLILKKRITISLEDDELNAKMSFLYNDDFRAFKNRILRMLDQKNNLRKLADEKNAGNPFANDIEDILNIYLFSPTAFIKNKYEYKNLEFILPDGSIFKLNRGSKVMKTVGRFAKIIHEEDFFEKVRIKQSQVMNEAKISANLCLSIHPLDYMTASYNENNWESCMHWTHGDYRNGVIEMMNSPFVIVAYLESDHDYLDFWVNRELRSMKWNSKKWREFIILSHEGIFGIKGYPYWNPHLEEIALKWIRDLFAEQNIIYSNKVVQWQVNNEIKDPSVDSSIRINMECGPSMYNDFYEGNTYRTILAPNLKDEKITINYSGPTECIVCGQTGLLSLEGHACADCVEHIYCHCCGEEILYDDESVRLEGEIYCRYCFDNRLPICDVCNDTLPVDEDFAPIDGIQFCVNHQDFPNVFIRDSYDSLELRTVCARCAEDVFVDGEKELHKTHGVRISWSWNNSVRSIISIQKIKDIEALSFYEDDLNVFNAEIEHLKKTEEKNQTKEIVVDNLEIIPLPA